MGSFSQCREPEKVGLETSDRALGSGHWSPFLLEYDQADASGSPLQLVTADEIEIDADRFFEISSSCGNNRRLLVSSIRLRQTRLGHQHLGPHNFNAAQFLKARKFARRAGNIAICPAFTGERLITVSDVTAELGETPIPFCASHGLGTNLDDILDTFPG